MTTHFENLNETHEYTAWTNFLIFNIKFGSACVNIETMSCG
jgi:hypothetical protein